MIPEIKVTVAGLQPLMAMMSRAPELVTEEITKAMKQSTLTIEGEAKQLVPHKTGSLRRSLVSQVRPLLSGVEGLVGTNIQYGPYVEIGTGIYGPEKRPITPKTAKVLAFKGQDGQMIFRKNVRGMPARPYLKPAFEESKARVEEFFRQALKRVLRRLVSGGR